MFLAETSATDIFWKGDHSHRKYNMLKIWIVRPGMTEFDQQGRILGTLDVPLNEEADEEIAAIIQQLSGQTIDIVYSSPHQSTVETAERICSALSIKHKLADQLINLNLGLWQGMLAEEIKRKQPKVFRQWRERPDTVCPPQGEMLETARFRIETFLAKIFKKHKDGVVAVVIPEPLVSLTASLLQQTEFKDVCQTNGARAEVIEIESPILTIV